MMEWERCRQLGIVTINMGLRRNMRLHRSDGLGLDDRYDEEREDQ
jgi:hypothetical protein